MKNVPEMPGQKFWPEKQVNFFCREMKFADESTLLDTAQNDGRLPG